MTRSVVVAVSAHLNALRSSGPLDTEGATYAAMALTIAELIDAGDPATMTAAWTKELRELLAVIKEVTECDDDDDAWYSTLPASVPDSKESG